MEGYLYILLSLKGKRTYTGSTDNLTRRIQEHQNGFVKSTKNRLPVKMVYSEKSTSLMDARKKEKYYKGSSGRKKLKNNFRECCKVKNAGVVEWQTH